MVNDPAIYLANANGKESTKGTLLQHPLVSDPVIRFLNLQDSQLQREKTTRSHLQQVAENLESSGYFTKYDTTWESELRFKCDPHEKSPFKAPSHQAIKDLSINMWATIGQLIVSRNTERCQHDHLNTAIQNGLFDVHVVGKNGTSHLAVRPYTDRIDSVLWWLMLDFTSYEAWQDVLKICRRPADGRGCKRLWVKGRRPDDRRRMYCDSTCGKSVATQAWRERKQHIEDLKVF